MTAFKLQAGDRFPGLEVSVSEMLGTEAGEA